MKKLLSGNEAIAQGAYEYGVKVAAGYPGTPSTEILETLSQYEGVYTEWAPNEKVALEVAIGASLTGIRAMATMKHVGLNVAADPLMTLSYTGVEGGLVIVVADDPGMHSSQNEQDSRNYARFAKVPLLEPSDSDEAKRFIGLALDISEKYDTPVIVRSTTRISHSKSIVNLEERVFEDRTPTYKRQPSKYLMVPSYARNRRIAVEERSEKLRELANTFSENKKMCGDSRLGIITTSICYQYVREVFHDATILKLSLSYPFPDRLARNFISDVENVFIVEELDPFIEEHVRALGTVPVGTGLVPRIGELNMDILLDARKQLAVNGLVDMNNDIPSLLNLKQDFPLPARPPVLCPGCAHRGVFYTLKQFNPVIIGDIGCYSLGGLPPLDSMDAIICMGAGVSAAMGVSKSGLDRPVVGIVGDSTFFHSGITGLLEIGYNNGNLTIIVLDNRVTAMTGHQQNPGTGVTLSGERSFQARIEKFAEASGITRIRVFDPYDLAQTEKVMNEELHCGKASLLISRRPCVLIQERKEFTVYSVDEEACKACGKCLDLGCPAIEKKTGKGKKWVAFISPALCTGCSVCAQVCPFDAISESK